MKLANAPSIVARSQISAFKHQYLDLSANGIERTKVGSVGQLVDVEDIDSLLAAQIAAQCRADKPRSTRDQYPHGTSPNQSFTHCPLCDALEGSYNRIMISIT
jgi:hypothetical protein